ncbi:MAG: penicillin-binding protein 2 [Bacteriovoracales bacterium]|nr:penicillin-binding protein 2 [Bacteriovoracales bacterium]
MFSEEEIVKMHRERATLIGNAVLISFAIILARLSYLQILKGEQLYRWSLQNRLRKEVVRAPRGMVYERNQELLVDNVPRFDAVITPQYLKDRKKTLKKLAHILEMKVEDIEQILKQNAYQAKYKSVLIKKNISRKEVTIIETENSKVPGASVETFISREYLDKEVGAHLLGYISEIQEQQLDRYRKRDNIRYKSGDFIGQFGLEEQMDFDLRGTDGHEFVEVDALGRKKIHRGSDYFIGGVKGKPVVPGHNLKLTIDRHLQQTGYEALDQKMGSVVALDIHTGEILAMISRPSFDPSRFSRGISSKNWDVISNDSTHPLRNRTTQEHYPPGSTFKVIAAIAGLEEGLIDEKTEYYCPGKFKSGRRMFHCWKKFGHQRVNLQRALRESCNIYFYKMSTLLGIDTLAKYAFSFGFGKKTGIALPREVSGLIPTREWKLKKSGQKWQRGETLSCVIGQSYILASPLQIAQMFAAVANGGKLYRPYFVQEVFTNSGKILKRFEPTLKSKLTLKKKTMRFVRKSLFEVANHPKGTAYFRRGVGIEMAGKTGTSQVMRLDADSLYEKCEELPLKERRHGIFGAFAPYHDPKIAVAAVIEHGCSGSKSAAPVVEKLITAYMKKYHPKKHEKIKRRERGRSQKTATL